jgi:hypothetical protein
VTDNHQRLRYRPLSQAIGRQFTIPAFSDIEKAVLQEMRPLLPVEFSLRDDPRHMAKVLTKYGALDLTFVASSPVLSDADVITWEALLNLGLATSQRSLTEEFEWVEKGLSDEECFFRLFLTWGTPQAAMELRDQQARAELAKGVSRNLAYEAAFDHLVENVGQRFPLTFTVDDACLTNSESIWVQAHFYL